MKLIDISDFLYRPPTIDLSNTFEINEKTNPNGTVDMTYNYNIGCEIVGLDDIPSKYIGIYNTVNGDSWKLISYRLYGTIDAWWILAKLNGVDDALEPLTNGQTVKYLDKGVMGNIYSEAKRISDSISES